MIFPDTRHLFDATVPEHGGHVVRKGGLPVFSRDATGVLVRDPEPLPSGYSSKAVALRLVDEGGADLPWALTEDRLIALIRSARTFPGFEPVIAKAYPDGLPKQRAAIWLPADTRIDQQRALANVQKVMSLGPDSEQGKTLLYALAAVGVHPIPFTGVVDPRFHSIADHGQASRLTVEAQGWAFGREPLMPSKIKAAA